ncbi:MAG: biotin--[acetyl-CoA-carboxylase] ligase [Hyphomicrobiaceae bacterium]
MTFHERAFPSPIVKLDEVDSTNAECLRRASGGERGPLWITAERQTAGRGRSGRAWTQAGGNLAASFLFTPDCPITALHQLSLLTGVAAHEAIEVAGVGTVPGLRLKWPNDILVERAKAGGILVETTTWGGTAVAVAGIGINIAHAPEIDGRAVARLGEHASGITPDAMLAALDAGMHRWLGVWQGGAGFGAVRDAWLARSGPVGEALAVNAGAERIEGSFHGIDDGGALLLRDGYGRLRRLTFGDVCLAGAAGSPAKGS